MFDELSPLPGREGSDLQGSLSSSHMIASKDAQDTYLAAIQRAELSAPEAMAYHLNGCRHDLDYQGIGHILVQADILEPASDVYLKKQVGLLIFSARKAVLNARKEILQERVKAEGDVSIDPNLN